MWSLNVKDMHLYLFTCWMSITARPVSLNFIKKYIMFLSDEFHYNSKFTCKPNRIFIKIVEVILFYKKSIRYNIAYIFIISIILIQSIFTYCKYLMKFNNAIILWPYAVRYGYWLSLSILSFMTTNWAVRLVEISAVLSAYNKWTSRGIWNAK
jgi:hypothetical protein